MFTTLCSNPWLTKMKIGSHAPRILPAVEVEARPITEPRLTIQLHRIALTNTVSRPARPNAS